MSHNSAAGHWFKVGSWTVAGLLSFSRVAAAVESRSGAVALGLGLNCCRQLSPNAGVAVHTIASVSAPRSSNRTCRFAASGSPMGFARRRMQLTPAAQRRESESCLALRYSFFCSCRTRCGVIRLTPISAPSLLSKRSQSEAPSLPRHYPASTVLWASPTSGLVDSPPCGRLAGRYSRTARTSHVALLSFSACCAHYPGGTAWVHLPVASPGRDGLPLSSRGSASAYALSRLAQASLALRPTDLLEPPTWPFVPGASSMRFSHFSPGSYLMPIGLFQQTTTGSVAECRSRFFRRRCGNSSRSLPVRRPAKSTWAPVAGRMGSYVRDARTGGPIG